MQFWFLDLSKTDSIMQECYSVFGPEPRLPSCMLRSYLLALKLKVAVPEPVHPQVGLDFTIDDDGVPVCKLGLHMHKDGDEATKHRAK